MSTILDPTVDVSDLSREQLHAIQVVLRAYRRAKRDVRPVLWHGAAGAGKSHAIHTLVRLMTPPSNDKNEQQQQQQQQQQQIAVTATTGIAAAQLGQGARTIHSFLGLGPTLPSIATLRNTIRSNQALRSKLSRLRILIVDEVSMMRSDLFDIVYHILSLFGPRPELPYGGIVVVFVGDFCQLPPVVTRREREAWCVKAREDENRPSQAFPRYIFQSPHYADHPPVCCTFSENFRQRSEDEEWCAMLARARMGEWNMQDEARIRERLLPNQDVCLDKLWDDGILPTMVYTHTVDVEAENQRMLSRLPNPHQTYPMEVSLPSECTTDPAVRRVVETTVANATRNNRLFADLTLAVGAQVIFKLNKVLGTDCRLVNGSRGCVVKLLSDSVVVRFDNGKEEIVQREPFRIVLESAGTRASATAVAGSYVTLYVLPLLHGWATTVHSCQGTTLTRAVMRLGHNTFFEPRMIYVALSRVRTRNGLWLYEWDSSRLCTMDAPVVEFLRQLAPLPPPPPPSLPSSVFRRNAKRGYEHGGDDDDDGDDDDNGSRDAAVVAANKREQAKTNASGRS